MLHGCYHTADSQLSRFGNSTGKTPSTMELETGSLAPIAALPIRQLMSGGQIIRAAAGIFRSRMVSAQLIESVPVNTIANLTNAGKAGS